MMLSNNYIPHITLPTYITDHSISLIDHIFIKESDKICNKITAGNIYNNITDHLPNSSCLEMQDRNSHSHEKRTMIRLYSEKNIYKFRTQLLQSNWDIVFQCQDANLGHVEFMKIYDFAFNQAFPLIILCRKRAKDKKWFTAGLKKQTSKLRFYKQKVRSPTVNNTSKYKRYWSIYSKCVQAAEQQYYKDLIDSKKQNVTTLWKIFGPVINPSKSKRKGNISKLINEHGVMITDNNNIANEFKKYFTSIGNQLAKEIKSNTSYKAYLKNPNLHDNKKLASKKASGMDNIRPKLLKACGSELSKGLAHIANLSFATANYPDQIKIAKVIPLLKKM